MAYKILENNAVDVTNIEGAAFNNFSAGNRDGIVGGYLNECALSATGNSVILSTGCLLIRGVRVNISEVESVILSSTPSADTRYQLIAQIMRASAEPVFAFSLFAQTVIPLIQDDIINETGTYQIEVGRFTHTTLGTITDVIRTADVLYGGASVTADIDVGEVTTDILAPGIDAEIDIDKRVEDKKTYLDFKFSLPSTAGTAVMVGDVEQASISFTSDPQTQISANTAERHSHSNKAILDATTASFLTAEKSKLAGIEEGAQVNAIPVNNLTSTSTVLPLAANQGSVLNVNKAESVLTGALDSLSITASSGVKRVYGKAVSGTISGTAELYLVNCTGAVTVSGTTAKLYVTNCPTLTISGNTVNVQFEKPFREVRIENTTGSNILVNMSAYSGWTMYLLSGQWSMQGVDVDGSPGTLEFYDRTWHSVWDRGTAKYGILLGYNSVNGYMQTCVFASGSIAYKETVSPNFAFWPGTKILLIAPREV